MKRHKLIPVPLYRQDLLVVIGTRAELKKSLEEVLEAEEFEQTWKEVKEPSKEPADGTTYKLASGSNLIHITNPTLEIMTHELYHATHNILNGIGVRPSPDSEEAYAYLIGYLMSQCEELL